MSDKNIFEKAGDIMENVTKFKKQSKLKGGYVERDEFKDSNLHKGFLLQLYILDRHEWRKMYDR